LNCLPLLSGQNWAQGNTSRVALVHIFLHPTGPSYDINGKFMNMLESKGSLAHVHRVELGSGHRLHLFGLV